MNKKKLAGSCTHPGSRDPENKLQLVKRPGDGNGLQKVVQKAISFTIAVNRINFIKIK